MGCRRTVRLDRGRADDHTYATVNGRTMAFGNLPPHTSALDWIRDLGFTGAKEVVPRECGACAILVARPSTTGDNTTEWVCINACLIPAASLEEQDVLTAEVWVLPTIFIRSSVRWHCAAARSAATAHRVSSARWPLSTIAPVVLLMPTPGQPTSPNMARTASTCTR